MSLLQNLTYKDYQKALEMSLRQCDIIAKLADLKISFSDAKKPGEQLIKLMDRSGFSVEEYKKYVVTSLNVKTITTYYRPQSKVAILVANDKYLYLSKLITPSIDCDSLAEHLQNLGFIVILIKNTTSAKLTSILTNIFDVLEENSYCFFFFAGHGCQLCNTKCMLGIDAPTENIKLEHCVTENFILKDLERTKQDLCILIMDMCRIYLDRKSNPQIYSSINTIDEYSIHKNLLIAYSTQTSQGAYEVLQIECSKTIASDVTYELQTGDTDKIVPGASQYVNVLCTRITEDLDISKMLDKVHEDIENALKKQRPIKVQCGVEKRSLYDPSTGDTATLLKSLLETTKDYSENCCILSKYNS
ncbi:unnamed protein product [Arctia plantaginis]|uniref:Caspase family p20 domain-containing protein n=1 Tax=Arctia plantaginis TaxID=874455 RepID=A0A8S0YNK8_ARCPL|nr:unnamed protein product [Arctia plantaginis]